MPATSRYVRRVGRPRVEWVPQVTKLALSVSGSWQALQADIADPVRWRAKVSEATFVR